MSPSANCGRRVPVANGVLFFPGGSSGLGNACRSSEKMFSTPMMISKYRTPISLPPRGSGHARYGLKLFDHGAMPDEQDSMLPRREIAERVCCARRRNLLQ